MNLADRLKRVLGKKKRRIIGLMSGMSMDGVNLAAGGQGAPLVSLADYVLYRPAKGALALNNLGSISNVTVVVPELDQLLSFDTGPANMAIDYFARLVSPSGIDVDGSYSCQGHVVEALLCQLLDNPFFNQAPPKAAGYAEFGPEALARLSAPFPSASSVDLLRTGVEFAAFTLEKAYRDFVVPRYPSLKDILFSGGGIYNHTLMQRIRERLPEFSIQLLPKIESDAKEALAFAILAHETLCGRPGTLPGLTGATRPTVLGEIAV